MWIILGIIAVLAVYVAMSYNNFIKLIQRTKEAWADIDVQLKRRYDLIPNLIETVKGFAAQERSVFEEVTEARAKATQVHVDPTNVTPESFYIQPKHEQADLIWKALFVDRVPLSEATRGVGTFLLCSSY